MVLDQTERLDQQVPPPRTIAEQCTHVIERLRINLPSPSASAVPYADRNPDECAEHVP